jgi:hypothetical protein
MIQFKTLDWIVLGLVIVGIINVIFGCWAALSFGRDQPPVVLVEIRVPLLSETEFDDED